ncbi:MAG TPA: hypothetical protein VNW92_12605 [Polyangiaceae bacterium]|nr:hypothetical protein [Polyangiaceae bacterium]
MAAVLPSLCWASRLLGVCACAFAASSLAACGDDMADPIVRAQNSDGSSGNGGQSNGDPGDLCAPCSTRYDCNAMESCVELSRGGDRFCSPECGDGNIRCPQGYVCSDVYNLSSLHCVPDTGDCNQVVF